MRKKGQTEVFGLAIIVILLFLGMVFVMLFMNKNQDKTSADINYGKETIAQNFINALMYTDVPDCSYEKVQNILIDCAENSDDDLTGGLMNCNNNAEVVNSCNYFKQVINEKIFKNVFDKMGLDYYFKVDRTLISGNEDEGFIKLGDKKYNKDQRLGIQPLPLPNGGSITVYLYIYSK